MKKVMIQTAFKILTSNDLPVQILKELNRSKLFSRDNNHWYFIRSKSALIVNIFSVCVFCFFLR